MARVYVSVGSNIDQNKYISRGVDALNQRYSPIICSPVYESVAVGFDGDNFYNLVVGFDTNESVDVVDANLNIIEDKNDRDRNGPKFSARTLDLDLLLYDQLILNSDSLTLPRPEIYENAFVLQPLADISDKLIDPISKKTFVQLWSEFDKNKQSLWQIEFDFAQVSAAD